MVACLFFIFFSSFHGFLYLYQAINISDKPCQVIPIETFISKRQPVNAPLHRTNKIGNFNRAIHYYAYQGYPFVLNCSKTNLHCKHCVDVWFAKASLGNDSWRVYDPSEADVFVVPTLIVQLARGFCRDYKLHNVLSHLDESLGKSQWYQRNNGSDHIFVASDFLTERSRFRKYRNIFNMIQGHHDGFEVGNPIPGHINVDCGQHTLFEKRQSRYLFHVVGQIDYRSAYMARRAICESIKVIPEIALQSVCASTSTMRKTVFNQPCQHTFVACTIKHGIDFYCNTLKQSKFLLWTPGDTPSSTRLYDAIANGVIPVVVHSEQQKYLPFRFRIPWKYLTLDLNVSKKALKGNEPHALIKGLRNIAKTPEDVLTRIRENWKVWQKHVLWTHSHSKAFHEFINIAYFDMRRKQN